MKKIFLIIFISSCVLGASQKNYNWKIHGNNFDDVSILVGGKSKNDFWYVDGSNLLSHYANGITKKFNTFQSGVTRLVRYNFFNDFIIALQVNQNWQTSVLKINSQGITNYGIISDVPLYLAQEYNSGILLAGDFGSMILMKENKFNKIETRLDAHIRAVLKTRENKILLALGDGTVALYNNERFTELTFKNNVPALLKGFYENKDGRVITKSDKNDIFILSDSVFVKANNNLFFPDYEIKNNRFFVNVFNKYKNKEETLELFPFGELKSFIIFQNGQYGFSNTNGEVFYNSGESKPLFIDYTRYYNLTASPVLYSLRLSLLKSTHSPVNPTINCISCSDINNDGWLDFILPGGQIPVSPNLFINDKGNSFLEFNELENIQPAPDGSFFWAIDLDNDNELEFLFNHWSDSNYTGKAALPGKEHFTYKNIFSLPVEYSSRNAHSITYCDFNTDGLLDLFITSSYGKSAERGAVFYYQNFGDYDFRRVNYPWEYLTVGWNQNTITADLDNNNLIDIYILRNWSNDLIILNDGDNYKYKSVIYTEAEKNQRKQKASFIDYDNDGDLDLLSLITGQRLILFENDGKGNFEESTEAFKNVQSIFPQSISYFTTGDFNNDGYVDVFISSFNLQITQNHLLLNSENNGYKLADEQWARTSDGVELCSTADIDNDGDLDIIGFNQERYFFLANTTDGQDYVKVKITGMSSNSHAIGSKIWLYENSGDAKKKLIGYKQIGSEHFDFSSQSLTPLHFGVKQGKDIDIKVLFPNGNIREVTGITSPAVITINEYKGLYGEAFILYKTISGFIQNKILTYGFLLFLLSLIFTTGMLYAGKYYFDWNKKSTAILFAVSILLYLFTSLYFPVQGFVSGTYTPLAVIFIFLAMSLLFSFWLNTYFSKKTLEDKNQELLNTILNFAHGQWASSNLISMQTLSANYSQVNKDEEFFNTLEIRKKTYLETVKPLISDIIKKLNIIPGQIIDESLFAKTFSDINKSLSHEEPDYQALANRLEFLRKGIAIIRESQVKKYSIDPVQIINSIMDEYSETIKTENIDYKLAAEIEEGCKVLCKPEDFAFTIDNCISNSLKALKKLSNKRELHIILKHHSSKIHIIIHDNGTGVDNEDKIFAGGYSGFGGTGMGLNTSVQKLSRFKGRIFLQNSAPFEDTSFIIELIKGI